MSKQATSSGIGLGGALTIVFVIAKIWDKIDWSWWWVFAPLWVSVGVAIGVVALVMLFAGIVWVGTPKKRPARTVSK